ncbi:MAG: tRNA (adenosine(37)-N6)-threonylcarbamoyltransferase complex ATPase subunit type 1 TsaE [Patescibacteria group bacterium]|nr:tRNA (adenosine(37)-N6)-threonylcarbamoyltransferase complex ATPase subunit type 1 TsaE [Patescibacteria group bacterium]
MNKIITNSEQETFDWAKNFARELKGGEVIGLIGDLGAGKTVFAKGLAEGLGIKKTVNSPTFVIMKIYMVKNAPARGWSASGGKSEIRNLAHIDAYRLKSEEDIIAIGADEYFARKDTITIIEWPENIKKCLPKKTIYVNICIKKENKRILNKK